MMMKRHTSLMLAALSLTMLSACGTSDDSDSADPEPAFVPSDASTAPTTVTETLENTPDSTEEKGDKEGDEHGDAGSDDDAPLLEITRFTPEKLAATADTPTKETPSTQVNIHPANLPAPFLMKRSSTLIHSSSAIREPTARIAPKFPSPALSPVRPMTFAVQLDQIAADSSAGKTETIA